MNLNIAFTLVDITQTNNIDSDNSKSRNQQRNWETVIQVIGLRSQPTLLSSPTADLLDLSYFRFGTEYTGMQKVWTFKFGTEQDGVYSNDVSPFGLLENDFVKVPIIIGLDESVPMSWNTFKVVGPQRNIYFQSL
jgi:hypothetical protein